MAYLLRRARLNHPALLRAHERLISEKRLTRRTMLVGSAGSVVAGMAINKVSAASLALGGYRVRTAKGRNGALRKVTVELNKSCSWVIDTSGFAGDPKLELSTIDKRTEIKLTGARFPGSSFVVNFTATISAGLMGNKVRFQFSEVGTGGCSFSCEAPLEGWLSGKDAAEAVLSSDASDRILQSGDLFAGVQIDPLGITHVRYLPSGGFEFNGQAILKAQGQTLPVQAMSIALEARSEDTLISGKTKAYTQFEAEPRGDWNQVFSVSSEDGWSLHGPGSKFDWVALEAHEDNQTALALSGSNGFHASLPGMATWPVESMVAAKIVGGDHDLAVVATLVDEEQWVHKDGVSFMMAPVKDSPVTIRSGRNGVVQGQPALEARQVAITVDNAIVSIHPESYPLAVNVAIDDSAIYTLAEDPVLYDSHPEIPDYQGIQIATTSTIFFEVMRPQDMLNLSFQTVNMSIQTRNGNSLVKANANQPSYLMVGFPPQALSEQTFVETALSSQTEVPAELSAPIKTYLSGNTRLVFYVPTPNIEFSLEKKGGLLDWSTFTQSVSGVALSYKPNIKIDPTWNIPVKFKIGDIKKINLNLGKTAGAEEPAPSKLGAGLLKTNTPISNQIKTGGNLGANQIKIGATQLKKKASISSAFQDDDFRDFEIANVAPNINPVLIVPIVYSGRRQPAPNETSIELPAKVILSPDEDATWYHKFASDSKPGPNSGSRTVLWHTRLGLKVDSKSGNIPIWLSDDGKWLYRITPAQPGQAGGEPYVLNGPERVVKEIHPTVRAIDLTDYSNPVDSVPNPTLLAVDRKMIVDQMTARSLDPKKDDNPFVVQNLMLTPLGGFLKGDYHKAGTFSGVTQWSHLTTLGRDHYVKVVKAGYLYPFMHKAVLVRISERKFQHTKTGGYYGVLRTREFVVITQPTVLYDAPTTNLLGFSKLTCITTVTPTLDLPLSGEAQGKRWLRSAGKPVLLAMRGTDMNGNEVNWPQAAAFVETGLAYTTMPSLGATPPFPASVVGGQTVAFAPDKPGSDPKKPGGTHYPCESMIIGAVAGTPNEANYIPSWRPILVKANISLPALKMLQPASGMNGSVAVRWAAPYRTSLFGSGNPSETFFELESPIGARFGDTSRSGGVVQPNMNIGAVSRKFGTLPAVPSGSSLSSNQYKINGAGADSYNELYASNEAIVGPPTNLPDLAKILGAVSLWDILPKSIDIAGDGKNTPKLTTTLVLEGEELDGADPTRSGEPAKATSDWPVGVSAILTWKPEINDLSVFKANNNGKKCELNLYGRATAIFKEYKTANGDTIKTGGSYRCVGEIKNFTIDLDVIGVYFDVVRFTAQSEQSVKFELDTTIKFKGALSFVGKLQQFISGNDGNRLQYPSPDALDQREITASEDRFLPATYEGFSVKPYMNVDGSGIDAGLDITLPDISIGVFSLTNLSFHAGLHLPFLGESFEVTFEFCTRDNPFHVSVYMITGGGYFGLTLAAWGIKSIEAAIEFGASVSINLGVASGGVSLMAGIYYRLDMDSSGNSTTTLTGYVRLNGELSILGIITMSLEFYLSLTWTGGNKVEGDASLRVEISILFFSIGVTVSVHKEFAGSGSSAWMPGGAYAALEESYAESATTIPFSTAVPQDLWAAYCNSFGEN